MESPTMDKSVLDTSKEAVKIRLSKLSKESRDVSKVWYDAIQQYNKTANDHKQETLILTNTPYFRDFQAMKKFGDKEMQDFSTFRTKGKNITRLRQLFMKHVDFIEAGSRQLLSAASASFPPAIVISTAMTFVLTGCKSQSADYDDIANFFEDMNNFFERVSIIGTRVPEKQAYQNALADVFISMLSLCAIARKFVADGRLKTWIKSSIFGGNADLAAHRSRMDNYLEWLQSATEFAILDNTENMLEQQEVMGNTLAKLRSELNRNEEVQVQIAASQKAAMEKMSMDFQMKLEEFKKLLVAQQEAKSIKGQNVTQSDQVSANVVRHFYGLVLKTKTEPFPDMLNILANLEKSQIEGIGSWLFEDTAWLQWADFSEESPSVLWLDGGPGMGKTYLGLSAYQRLCSLRSSERDICVAYFLCHRPDPQRRHFRDLVRNCAIQIAEQNPAIRRELEAKWRKFELHAGIKVWEDDIGLDNEIFILDNFRKESDKQLFIVIDNIEQFDQVSLLQRFVSKAEDQELRINFLITSTEDESDDLGSIRIDKTRISPDLRKILWKNINSEDSAFDGLRKLSKYCKQKMARKIEQNADNLLYVDQILRFLADEAREGNDIEEALDNLPADLTALYEKILENCLDGLSPEQAQSLKSIFAWLTVSWHPLTTEWLDLLVKIAGRLSGAQVSSSVLRFFEIDTLSGDTTSLLDINLTELFEESLDISTQKSSSRGSLRLQAKNRSIRDFFTDADSKHKLRSSFSDAHRLVFLATVDIILYRKKETPQSLYEYSVGHSFMHWENIDPEEHTDEEQAEVCKAFFQLLGDDNYADGLVRHSYCWCLATISLGKYRSKWYRWSNRAAELPLPTETAEYWQDGRDVLHPLTLALVRYWLRTVDVDMAVEAWIWANGVHLGTSIERDELRRCETKQVLDLAGILGSDLDSHAYLAIASVLASSVIRSDIPSAIQQLRKALDHCRDAALRTQCYVRLAAICIERKDLNAAIENCKLGMDSEHASVQRHDIIVQEKLAQNHQTQLALRIELLRMSAVAKRGLGMNMEAANSLREARQLSTEIVPAEHLFNELLCLQKEPDALVERLLDFKFIDRLHFLTGDSYALDGGVYISPTRIILPAVIKSQGAKEIVNIYREIIKALDTEQAGAPVRVDLARIMWRLRYDKKDVRFLLNQVLDSVSEERRYKLTDREPMSVAHSALLLMVDILLDEFRSSRKVEDKVQILLQAKELPRRKFLASQPLITDAVWDPYSIAVAEMLRKIGPMSEYQQLMEIIFNKAIAGLSDNTELNDSVYLISLSRILMMFPSLRRFGEILYALHQDSAKVEDDKGNEDPSYCDGICLPVTKLNRFNPSEPHYKCLICTDSRLCQSCYETRMRWNVEASSKTDSGLGFCCPNGHYMRIPMEGWRGIKGETLEFTEGVEAKDIRLKQVIEDVKVAWENAWGDLASGIN